MAQTCSDTISHLTLVSWNPLRPEAIAGTVRSAFSVGSPPSSDGNPANRRKKKKPFEKDWTHTECLISESYEEVESVAIVAPLLASVNPLVQRPRKICVRQIHVNLHLYVQESNLRPSEVQRHQWWCICHHLEIRWWSKNLWEVFNPLHANAVVIQEFLRILPSANADHPSSKETREIEMMNVSKKQRVQDL